MGRITFLKCAVGSKPKGRDAHPKSYVSRKTAEVQEGKTRPRKGAVPKAGVKNIFSDNSREAVSWKKAALEQGHGTGQQLKPTGQTGARNGNYGGQGTKFSI